MSLKTITTKNGKELNYLDGKLISKARAEELKTIDVPNTTVTTIDKPQAVSKVCLFCGEEATHTKFVHLQVVNLCSVDYYQKTTGEIGELIQGAHLAGSSQRESN